MRSRRDILVAGAGGGLTFLAWAEAGCAQVAAGPTSATAVTEVFGDGQKFVAVVLDYGRPVDGAKLSAATFKVEERTVTGAYASAAPVRGAPARSGRYVVVELSPTDPAAVLKQARPPGGGGGGGGGGPPTLGSVPSSPPTYRTPRANVVQAQPVARLGGAVAPGAAIETVKVSNPIVDDFTQHEFRHPRTGELLRYNLFTPKGYDRSKSYPLVLFMHDAGATGPDPLTTLRQGLGAIAFATPRDQAKHPSFVLAPQFARVVVNDDSQSTSELDTTIELIRDLAGRYSIDRTRLYTTGQSGGAMMSLAMGIKYPGFFAASYIVAGQWAPELCKPLASAKLWIVVAEGDEKAFPGENAITKLLEGEGARVARATWDGRWEPEQFAAAVADMRAKGASINYAVLQKGSVVPPGQPDNGGTNHVNTWRIAYTIEGIRDWMFQQRNGGVDA